MDSPANSSHLRKSGSRLVVYDIGILEDAAASVFEEDTTDAKATTTIIPSPLVKFNLHVLLFIIWGVTCCKVSETDDFFHNYSHLLSIHNYLICRSAGIQSRE